MKRQTLGHLMVAALASYIVAGFASSAFSQPVPIVAEVRNVKGTATFSVPGGPGKPLKTGATLIAPTTVKTGPESTVDLFMGSSAGIIRIAQNTSISIDKLTRTETGADDAIEAQMNLPKGQVFFDVNKVSQASRYEIKVPYGVAGIRGTGGGINDGTPNPQPDFGGRSLPPVLLTDGRLIQVHNPPGGAAPVAYTLTAPPAVAWSPTGGVQPAPPEDIRYVTQQIEQSKQATMGPIPEPQPVPKLDPFVSTTLGSSTVQSGGGGGGN
jgi:hypothetical protein